MADASDSGGRLTPEEVARFSEQVGGLSAAGLPLGPGLRAAAEEMPPGRLRYSLSSIASALESGASLEDVVHASGDRLPGHLRGLVQIGVKTGRLSEVLGRFVSFMNVGIDLRRQLFVNMILPALALGLGFLIFAFVCSYLVNAFERIFADFGVPLPLMTVGLIRLGRMFGMPWQVFIALVLSAVLVIAGFSLLDARIRRSLLSGIPVLGLVWRNSALAEFCHLLGLLVESQVPLGEALRLTGEGVADASLDRACHALGTNVDAGLTLSQAMSLDPHFPKGLAQIVKWAEGNQGLPLSLHMAGEMYEARARTQATFVGTVLSVLSVMTLLTGVFWLVISLFLPLITLITKLSG